MAPDDSPMVPRSGNPCPICGKPAAPSHRPFCSPRCRYIDLNRWLKGSYKVETEDAPEDEADETG
jgi:hypothetical protein